MTKIIHCEGHAFALQKDGKYHCMRCDLKVKTRDAALRLVGKKS